MKRTTYPFAAIVGQSEMKLALLLAAVDWRLSVLLRGEKGSAKTTAARGLAALLPEPAPFINLPIGATEDRLVGGLHLERTLQGDPALKPGLLSEAHGGVLYVDEINLLPSHLGDMLLDTAACGVNIVEREGLSASHAAEFVLLGSMNPEEGTLRPQLLDRFALAVDVYAPLDPTERQTVVERRIGFDRNAEEFAHTWVTEQQTLRERISVARARLGAVECSGEMLGQISAAVCEAGVRSLRADLALMRACISFAALSGDTAVEPHHLETVLPFVLAHRIRHPSSQTPPKAPPSQQQPPPPDATKEDSDQAMERIFAPLVVDTPKLHTSATQSHPGQAGNSTVEPRGPAVRSRLAENPSELDLRASVRQAVVSRGTPQPSLADLHERVREPGSSLRYVFLIDSSGSHASRERMRAVKGAAESLLTRSFRNQDEVALIAFRGAGAEVVLQPTMALQEAIRALEYLPTGGRTPLAHGLQAAKDLLTPSSLLVVLTDGRANVALRNGDPWEEAMEIAEVFQCPALVIDTEDPAQPLGRSRDLALALRAEYSRLDDLGRIDIVELARRPALARST
ncbi:MAG TPA: VWA domain-containing protein [Acidobacteriaceae bacterium]|jgi:magnesium chelatase subunit D